MTAFATRCLLLVLGWLPLLAAAQNRPDLVVVPPYTVPVSMVAGGSYQLSGAIKNQGTTASQFNCIGYYLSADATWDATDSYLGTNCQGFLMPGQSGPCSVTATISALTPAGSRYVLLVADPLNAEQESDETNNVLSFAVTITSGLPPQTDLWLWRPSLSFGAVPPGGSTGAFTFINNSGPTAVSYEIGCYLSTDTVFSATTDIFLGQVASSLSANTMTIHSLPVLTIPATVLPGNYYLVLMADPRNLIAESNENNNSRALPLRVTGALAATTAAAAADLVLYPNPVPAGSSLQLARPGGLPPGELLCYNALGQVVARQTSLATPLNRFDTSQLPTGTYLLRLSGPWGAVTRRFSVE